MAKSPEEMAAAMIANLEEKTGKNIDAWLRVARASKLDKHGKLVAFLKSEHGVTHGYANLIAHSALKSGAGDSAGSDLIDAQYSGKKAALRPLYDRLVAAIGKFGKADIAPKKAYVSLRGKKQFAIIQPSTATRLDVGINLKGTEPTDRLEASGSFNSMVSHRVRVTSSRDIDAELIGWLKRAYEAAS